MREFWRHVAERRRQTARLQREAAQELAKRGRVFVLGLTGPYASGKSTLGADLVTALEPGPVLHIEVDRLGHEALVERADAVLERFGREVAGPGGGIDRKALGRRVFANPNELSDLEGILHPAMVDAADRQIRDFSGGVVILNAAVLFQMGLQSRCHWIVLCTAPRWVRTRRAIKRDSLTRSEARRRILAQDARASQLFPRSADIRKVENWGGKRARRQIVRTLVKELWSKIEVSSSSYPSPSSSRPASE